MRSRIIATVTATGLSAISGSGSADTAASSSILLPEMKRRGMRFVGLDVIGTHLTEINVTSPTGMQEIAQQTPCDPAALMIDALERLAARPAPGTDVPGGASL